MKKLVKDECNKLNIPFKTPKIYPETRWNYVYTMLKSIILL